MLAACKGGFNMSKENIKLLYETLAKDKGLQEKFKSISKKYEGQKPDQDRVDLIYWKEILPLAEEAGFKFTLAELKEYAEEFKNTAIHQLSEEEMAIVAGGFFVGSSCDQTGTAGCQASGSPGMPG
jgi:hypothetical protein